MSPRLAPLSVVAVLALASATADAAPATGVLVWPTAPGQDTAGAERAVTEAGFRVVPFAPVGARLAAHGDAARERETAVLELVEVGLAEVRRAYLEQRFDDMLVALARIEGDALEVVARPEHRAVLWEIEFQMGLAYHSRRGDSDAALARARFELCLALDPERRPERELYGPEVAAAFADALDARSKKTPRPVRIAVGPSDARVVVDGVPLVDSSLPRNLRQGMHAVAASAPGFAPTAFLAAIDTDNELQLALDRNREADAVDRIGAAWSNRELRANTASGRAAIRAAAAAAGAVAVLIVDIDDTSGAAAWLLTADQASEPVRAATVEAAAAGAIAPLAPDGRLRRAPAGADPLAPAPRGPVPIYRRPIFWIAAGAVLATGVILIVSGGDDEPDRLVIVGPQ